MDRANFTANTVDELLTSAAHQFGADFVRVLESSRVWVNGENADLTQVLGASDEVAVLPPVSGG